MGRLSGEVALITGSTAGIGKAIAQRFAEEGASVIVTGRDRERGDRVVLDCEGRGIFVSADLNDPGAADALVNAAADQFGRLTILVNNAAGSASDGPVAKLT